MKKRSKKQKARLSLIEKYPFDEFVKKFTDGNQVHQKGDDRNQAEYAYDCFINYQISASKPPVDVLPKLEIGDKIKLYGRKTTVEGFDVVWNEGLIPPQYEIILLTTKRGDPFKRSLSEIEILTKRKQK